MRRRDLASIGCALFLLSVGAGCLFDLEPLRSRACGDASTAVCEDAPGDSAFDTQSDGVTDADAASHCDADVASSTTDCGACGHDCLGGACIAGKCQPLAIATGQKSIYGLAQDADTLYFVLQSVGDVRSLSKNDPKATPRTIASGQGDLRYLDVDATTVYWSTYGGTIGRASKGASVALPPLVTGEAVIRGISVDETNVYYTADNRVRRVRKAGGSPAETFATALPFDGGVAQLRSVLVDGTTVYWANHDTGELWQKATTDTGDGKKRATGLDQADGLAVDSIAVYWTSWRGAVYRAVKGTPTPAQPVFSTISAPLVSPNGIVSEGGTVFFIDGTANRVFRASVSPWGVAEELPAGSTAQPVRIVADAKAIYWSSNGSGEILRLAR